MSPAQPWLVGVQEEGRWGACHRLLTGAVQVSTAGTRASFGAPASGGGGGRWGGAAGGASDSACVRHGTPPAQVVWDGERDGVECRHLDCGRKGGRRF